MKRQKIFRIAWIIFLIALALNVLTGVTLAFWSAGQIRKRLPPGSKLGEVRWSWPMGIALTDLEIPDTVTTAKQPFFFKVKRIELQFPLWGILIRPLPAHITLEAPHLKASSENIFLVAGELEVKPTEWLNLPFMGTEQTSQTQAQPQSETPPLAALPFLPIGLIVKDGIVDAVEEQIRQGQPVFRAAHIDLKLVLTAVSIEPTIQLTSSGDFVTEQGEVIGKHNVQIQTQPRKKIMSGRLEFSHDRLADFRNLYQYAPRPIAMESGRAKFRMDFTITNGHWLKLTAACTVENLNMEGKGGDLVPWKTIMRTIEDNGSFSWEFSAEGDMQDPKFDPHDSILSQVEWKMKEVAASRGLEIPGQLFFYADTPGPDEQ